MRRIVVVRLATLVFCLSIMVPPVVAVNSQGLTWTVYAGARYDYLWTQQRYLSGELDLDHEDRVYLLVDDVPEIPLTVSNLSEISDCVNRSSYYENGTQIEHDLDFIWNVLPVGNWSLISELFLEQSGLDSGAIDVIDTPTLWGSNFTYVDGPLTYIYSDVYLKSSGVMYGYTQSTNYTSDTYSLYIRTATTYVRGPGQGDEVLLVAGLVAAGAIGLVAVLLFLRKRR